jgi:hypothetical protein
MSNFLAMMILSFERRKPSSCAQSVGFGRSVAAQRREVMGHLTYFAGSYYTRFMSHLKLFEKRINPILPDLYKITAKNRRFFAVILYKSGKIGFIHQGNRV